MTTKTTPNGEVIIDLTRIYMDSMEAILASADNGTHNKRG